MFSVDGYFEKWSEWGECSTTCGRGTRIRTRECTPPIAGGADCIGDREEQEDCDAGPCPGEELL